MEAVFGLLVMIAGVSHGKLCLYLCRSSLCKSLLFSDCGDYGYMATGGKKRVIERFSITTISEYNC